jgi:hypothetical protein
VRPRDDAPIYISGDTTCFDGVAKVAKRFKAGAVLPFAGAAQTSGPCHLTMDVPMVGGGSCSYSAASSARVDRVDGLSVGILANNSPCVGWIDGTTALASEVASSSSVRAATRLTTSINVQMT